MGAVPIVPAKVRDYRGRDPVRRGSGPTGDVHYIDASGGDLFTLRRRRDRFLDLLEEGGDPPKLGGVRFLVQGGQGRLDRPEGPDGVALGEGGAGRAEEAVGGGYLTDAEFDLIAEDLPGLAPSVLRRLYEGRLG